MRPHLHPAPTSGWQGQRRCGSGEKSSVRPPLRYRLGRAGRYGTAGKTGPQLDHVDAQALGDGADVDLLRQLLQGATDCLLGVGALAPCHRRLRSSSASTAPPAPAASPAA